VTGREANDLAAVVAAALAESGRTLDHLTTNEALELANTLRATLAALPTPTPRDVRLAAALVAGAAHLEGRPGIT